jgi:hypothetical protein
MDEPAKLYGQEWRGELLILYGRHEDGSEVAIVLPPGALTVMAASKPPSERKGEWTQATPLPVEFFQVGDMPMEREPLITIEVNTTLGSPLLFVCSIKHAQQLARLLDDTVHKAQQGSTH